MWLLLSLVAVLATCSVLVSADLATQDHDAMVDLLEKWPKLATISGWSTNASDACNWPGITCVSGEITTLYVWPPTSSPTLLMQCS